MKRVLLSICVLLVLAAGTGWVAETWDGTIELWNWKVSQETSILTCVQEDTFVVEKSRSYPLRINEQVPPKSTCLTFAAAGVLSGRPTTHQAV